MDRPFPPMVSLLVLACLLACLLGGCDAPWFQPAGAALGANIAAVPVIHRTLPDALYSLVTGRDCSAVRLDQGLSYCRPQEPPPTAPPYCTRSLALVDCWADPVQLPAPLPRGVAQGPSMLTPAQEADRTRGWPGL